MYARLRRVLPLSYIPRPLKLLKMREHTGVMLITITRITPETGELENDP